MVRWDHEVERAFRWYLSCCDEGQEVLYLTLCTLYRGDWHHPTTFFRKTLDWEYDEYSDKFTMAERAILKLDDDDRHFDIYKAASYYGVQLSLRILKWTCGLKSPDVTKWDEMPPDSLEGRLQSILSNVQQFYDGVSTAVESEEQLEKEVDGLKELYSNVLHEAGCRAGRDFSSTIAGVLSRLDNVLGDCRPLEDPQRYTNLLLREGQLELFDSLITDECPIRPLQLAPLILDRVYTELTLLEQNVEGSFTITPRFFPASKIFSEVTKGRKGLRGHAVIGGPVGCGKSTLFRQMQNYWARGGCKIVGLDQVQLYFIVNLCTTRATTADELIRQEVLPRTTGCFPPGRVLPAFEDICVLWVLDGYDRANTAARNLAHDVYKTFSLVFLTCQQDFLPVCLPVVINTGIPPLCLILDHPRGTKDSLLASRVLKQLNNTESEKEFMRFSVARGQRLDHLMTRPLHVTLLCILYHYSPKSLKEVHSLTDVYRRTVLEMVNVLTEKMAKEKTENRQDFFLNVTHPWLGIMAEDAWKGLQAGSHLMQEGSIQKIKDLCGDEATQLVESLLDSRPRRGGGVEYFWGLSELQDHFAATHIFNSINAHGATLCTFIQETNARYNNMLFHLMGLFACHDTGLRKYHDGAVKIIHYLKDSGYSKEKEHCLAGKINRWLALCIEAKMASVVVKAVATMLPQLRFGDDDLALYYPVVERILTQNDELLVSLHIKTVPQNVPRLPKLLQAITPKKHKLWLALVGSATAYGKKEVADAFLEDAVKKKQLQIVSVEGHYSAAFLKKLPDSVKQLHVRVMTTDELEMLANRIKHLRLYAFNLVLDLPELRNDKAHIPHLKINWLDLTVSDIPVPGLWVFVPLLKDCDLPWFYRMLVCLYPKHYERLYLTACQLSPAGVQQVIVKLRLATRYTVDELIFDKPDGSCGHYNFLAERITKKKGAGSLTAL